jgi:nitroreductase
MSSEVLYDSLKTICSRRRSIRRFSEKPLSVEQIAAIREVAGTAPYASGKKNWDLLVVTDRNVIRELAGIVQLRSSDLGYRVRDDFRGMFLEYTEHFTAFETAPALFIPVYKVQHSISLMLDEVNEDIIQWERDNFVKSISCVAMLVLLAAESLGLGGCYMTGPIIAGQYLSKQLPLRKGYEIAAIIPVGYPQGDY